jgi:hypothetical protein
MEAENGWARLGGVATYAFKDRTAVADDVGKNMDLGIVPINKPAVVPDLLGGG